MLSDSLLHITPSSLRYRGVIFFPGKPPALLFARIAQISLVDLPKD